MVMVKWIDRFWCYYCGVACGIVNGCQFILLTIAQRDLAIPGLKMHLAHCTWMHLDGSGTTTHDPFSIFNLIQFSPWRGRISSPLLLFPTLTCLPLTSSVVGCGGGGGSWTTHFSEGGRLSGRDKIQILFLHLCDWMNHPVHCCTALEQHTFVVCNLIIIIILLIVPVMMMMIDDGDGCVLTGHCLWDPANFNFFALEAGAGLDGTDVNWNRQLAFHLISLLFYLPGLLCIVHCYCGWWRNFCFLNWKRRSIPMTVVITYSHYIHYIHMKHNSMHGIIIQDQVSVSQSINLKIVSSVGTLLYGTQFLL